jgi:hypothetical protein
MTTATTKTTTMTTRTSTTTTTTTTTTMTKTMMTMMITTTTTMTTTATERREEAQWRDERFQRRVETSDDVDVKTDDDNFDVNVDNNGAAGGGTAAQRTKTMTHQNRHVFVSSQHISPTRPICRRHRNF